VRLTVAGLPGDSRPVGAVPVVDVTELALNTDIVEPRVFGTSTKLPSSVIPHGPGDDAETVGTESAVRPPVALLY
jgi:hypothetical protein